MKKSSKVKLSGSIYVPAGLNFFRAIEENPELEIGIPHYNLPQLRAILEKTLDSDAFEKIVSLYGILCPVKSQKEMAVEYNTNSSTLSRELHKIMDKLRSDSSAMDEIRSLAPSAGELFEEICELRKKDADRISKERLEAEIAKREAAVQGNKLLEEKNASLMHDNERLEKKLQDSQREIERLNDEKNQAILDCNKVQQECDKLADLFVSFAKTSREFEKNAIAIKAGFSRKNLDFGVFPDRLKKVLRNARINSIESLLKNDRRALIRMVGLNNAKEIIAILEKHGLSMKKVTG